jgi:hypothetical protein
MGRTLANRSYQVIPFHPFPERGEREKIPAMKTKTESLTLRLSLPASEAKALRRLANKHGLTLDEIVSRLIRNTDVVVNAENEGTGLLSS